MTLTLENVSYSYRTKYQTVHAVQDVSCTLEPGLFYALVGKSGSGKTTLLSMMAGLERPESGSVRVDGKDLKDMDVDRYRRDIASVIYQNYNLFPLLTILENVMYPMLLQKKSKAEASKRAGEVLARVGLDNSYWKRLPAMLSGGEQQRVAIARALAINADIILADEPTGNLDGENTKNIIDLLYSLAHEEGCCVVVITHDSSVADVADRVYHMDSGRLHD